MTYKIIGHYMAITAFVSLGISLISLGISLIIQYANEKKFKEICRLYEMKFYILPPIVSFYLNGLDPYSMGQKITYFSDVLFYRKGSWLIRGVKDEEYDFIRNLPKELTHWIVICIYFRYVFYVLFIVIILIFLILKYVLSRFV